MSLCLDTAATVPATMPRQQPQAQNACCQRNWDITLRRGLVVSCVVVCETAQMIRCRTTITAQQAAPAVVSASVDTCHAAALREAQGTTQLIMLSGGSLPLIIGLAELPNCVIMHYQVRASASRQLWRNTFGRSEVRAGSARYTETTRLQKLVRSQQPRSTRQGGCKTDSADQVGQCNETGRTARKLPCCRTALPRSSE